MNEDTITLISAYLDGELTEGQQGVLAAWLRQDPANVDRFVAECRCHSGLLNIRSHLRTSENHNGRATREPAPAARIVSNAQCGIIDDESPTHVAPVASAPPLHHSSFILHPSSFFTSVPLAYAAVVLMLGAGLLAARHWSVGGAGSASGTPSADARLAGDTDGPAIAQLTGTDNCRWADPKTVAWDGETLAPGHKLAISSGLLGITYSTGARVTMVGPATYVVDSASSGSLSLGTISVFVPQIVKEAKNLTKKEANRGSDIQEPTHFCVRTPGVSLTTHTGGEFRVHVDETGVSSAFVVDGTLTAEGAGGWYWKHGRQRPTVVYREGEKGSFAPGTDEQRGEKSSRGS